MHDETTLNNFIIIVTNILLYYIHHVKTINKIFFWYKYKVIKNVFGLRKKKLYIDTHIVY